jgi:diguanylate cyclase (GGDEF)-like protein
MKILIAEDEVVSRRMLESTLRKWGYDVVAATNGTEASQLLKQPDSPKLAILDWMMPGRDGVDLCRDIRSRGEVPYTYILLLTGKTCKEDIIAGLDAGADDYITKPFEAQELKVRLRAGQRILQLQEELIAAREAMRDQATHDSLTGVWNRAAIMDVLGRELDRARREASNVAVIMADLDHFKSINDTYGHNAGDAVLCEATRRMGSSMRSYDSLGRVGGEEFLIVLPGCDSLNATCHAERMRSAISGVPVVTPEGSIAVTASLGVAIFGGGVYPDADVLIRGADAALYHAKHAGRNRVELGVIPSSAHLVTEHAAARVAAFPMELLHQ